MGRRTLLPATALAACLVGVLAARSARAELHVVVPPGNAVLGSTPVTLIGTGAVSNLEVSLNGKRVEGAKQSGKAFTVSVPLVPGENTVLVKSGDESQKIVYTYAPKDQPASVFRYHPPVAEGDCKSCHPQGVGRTFPVSEAKLCNNCHDPKTGGKRLHGPLGTGQCSTCHDPHGSGNPKFLVMNVRALCVQCHAQTNSKTHIEKSGNKRCPECHDPHSSDKQYLLR
ncbi:MAG TPA: cytochrome c3 family protein [bacterium]